MLVRRGNQARLLHQTPHDLLRDAHGLIAQAGMDPAVSVAAVVAGRETGDPP